jgi:AraC family transcriptional regulator
MFGTSPSLYKQTKHDLLKEIAMIKPVRIEDIRPISVYCARNTGPYDSCGAAWETLMKFAYTQKFKCKKNLMGNQARMFGISYDDPDVVAPENLRYDACITADDEITLENDIEKREISGGRYIVFLHKGPYDGLSDTYSSAYRYVLENYQIRDVPSFEQYLNRDPRRTKPENLKTEIWIPVE